MGRRKDHEEFEILQIVPAAPGTRALSLYNNPDGGDDWEEEPVACFALCRWDLSFPEEQATFTNKVCGITNDGETGLSILEEFNRYNLLGYLMPGVERDAFVSDTIAVQAHADRIRRRAKGAD